MELLADDIELMAKMVLLVVLRNCWDSQFLLTIDCDLMVVMMLIVMLTISSSSLWSLPTGVDGHDGVDDCSDNQFEQAPVGGCQL